MRVERKWGTVMRPLHGLLGRGRGRPRVPVFLVAMVTLDHSSPRPPAHLFSTLGLGAGSEEQPERVGQAPLGLGLGEATYTRTERGGNPQARSHPPLPVAGCHLGCVSLVSPTFWQGWARVIGFPCVCEIRF